MKRNRIISSLLSAVLLIAVLLGSGGMTLIIHSCEMCGAASVETVSIINPSANNEVCCSTSAERPASEGKSISAGCCKYTTEQFKLTNYVKSEKSGQANLTHFFFTAPFVFIPEFTAQILKPQDILNKHGGRHIVNFNCQLLS